MGHFTCETTKDIIWILELAEAIQLGFQLSTYYDINDCKVLSYIADICYFAKTFVSLGSFMSKYATYLFFPLYITK